MGQVVKRDMDHLTDEVLTRAIVKAAGLLRLRAGHRGARRFGTPRRPATGGAILGGQIRARAVVETTGLWLRAHRCCARGAFTLRKPESVPADIGRQSLAGAVAQAARLETRRAVHVFATNACFLNNPSQARAVLGPLLLAASVGQTAGRLVLTRDRELTVSLSPFISTDAYRVRPPFVNVESYLGLEITAVVIAREQPAQPGSTPARVVRRQLGVIVTSTKARRGPAFT